MHRSVFHRSVVLSLIGIVLMSLPALYVPHHHHDGIICIEAEDTTPPHADSGECQLDNLMADLRITSGVSRSLPLPDLYFQTILYPSIHPETVEITVAPLADNLSVPESYPVKSHKLRGSPFFS